MSSNYRCVNFYDLCRLCTACTDEKKCDIFSQEGKRKELSSKIDECLGLEVHEKDQLPKVLCSQCVQHVDNISQFRNICKSSQEMLNNCLQTATQQQNGGKVYIKDAVVTPSGKSLSVMQGPSVFETQQSQQRTQQPTTMTDNSPHSICNQTLTPASGTQLTPLFQQQHNNDFLNSIMQAVGIQALDSASLPAKTPSVLQQYTITLGNKGGEVKAEPVEYILPTNEHTTTPSVDSKTPEKETKNNALEEFLRMKPNIKVTPIKKKLVEQQQSSRLQQQKQQQQPQQQQLQSQTIQQQVVQQQLQQQTQQYQQNQSTTPQQQQFQQQQVAQLQLQQLQQQIQQQLQQQLQQQQLQQQLQQITEQLQSQTQHQLHQQAQQQITISSDDLSSSKNKKPKLNFIISSPTTQALAATTSAPAAPQIQLHFPSSTTTAQQQQQSNATAVLLQNLAPLLQQQQPIMQQNNALSPNKCFLPITIKDENSDQQIIAHIDAKNFMLPTTYQLQMKLQPQIQTVDGQPIMQLTPTSIPATLQIAPHALSNQTFQAAATVATTNQQLQQQIQQQQQNFRQQQKSLPQTVQITSQQILATPNKQTISNNKNNTNNTSLNSTHDAATSTTDQNDEAPIFTNSALQQRQPQHIEATVNVTKSSYRNNIEIIPTTNLTQQIMQQVQNQQKQRKLQQQQQNQKQKPHQNLQTNTTTTTLPTKHGGITVQRITTTKAAAEKAQQAPKLPTLNRQNVTISRISTQQQQPTRSMPKHSQQLKTETSPKRQQQKLTKLQQQHPQNHVFTLSQTTDQQDLLNTFNQIEQQQQATALAKSKIVATKKLTWPNKTPTATTTNYNMTAASQTLESACQQQQQGENAIGNNHLLTNTSNTAHGTGPDGVGCSQCGRVFKKKEHLMQHIKLHAGVRPFKCTEEGCNKDFSRKEHLLRHLVSHSGKKLFNCEVCQKLFSRKDNLNKHRRIHSDQPNSSNYTCEICHKSFAIKVYYQQHKLIHETEVKKEKSAQQNSTVTQQTPATQQGQQQQQPTQQNQQHIQILQQQQQHQQQQIMQLQLPDGVVTTQDLASNTITITQSNDLNNRSEKSIGSHDTTVLNLPTSLANFVQLGQAQFVNATTGEIMGHIKIEK